MVKRQDLINKKIIPFYKLVKDLYPIKNVILYGSYAKDKATKDSDIDLGIVVDYKDHLKRIEITAKLFHYARKIDSSIEPKCIFLDEFENIDDTSILSEIIRTGIKVV